MPNSEQNAADGNLLRIPEVARRLNVHDETVRRLLRAHKLIGIKIGRGWRVARGEIDQRLRKGAI
jgi:excisionase family DNA binding protein